jgi:hypothetical protein
MGAGSHLLRGYGCHRLASVGLLRSFRHEVLYPHEVNLEISGAWVGFFVAQYNGSLCENSYPPARLTLYPDSVNFAITFSQWSPWISIFPCLTVPPEPHNFLSCCASVVSSASFPITPSITVTVFPPCPFRSRLTRTIPSLFFDVDG